MPLIAITREMGACGADIAAKVANALHVPLVHHEIADQVAAHWGVRREDVLHFSAMKPPPFKWLHSLATRNFAYVRSEVLLIAVEGRVVFRGWGAAQMLFKVPHALCVHVGAPFNIRVARMRERLGLKKRLVERMVHDNDAIRALLARVHAGIDWRDPNGYDLAINTERSPVDDAVEEIVTLAHRPTFQETLETRQTLESLRLEAHARAILCSNPATRGLRIHVKVSGEELILGGIVNTGDQREEIVRMLSNVSPGISVTSRLRAHTDYRTRSSSI